MRINDIPVMWKRIWFQYKIKEVITSLQKQLKERISGFWSYENMDDESIYLFLLRFL